MTSLPCYDSSLFFYKDKTFTADVSELESNGPVLLNIAIKSSRTGDIKKFFRYKTHKDSEGDITHWTYVPIDRALASADIKVIIFND